jgi:hypothetical protein
MGDWTGPRAGRNDVKFLTLGGFELIRPVASRYDVLNDRSSYPFISRSRGSSVGIATGHGLEGRGSGPGKVKNIVSTSSRRARHPTWRRIQWTLSYFHEGKAARP